MSSEPLLRGTSFEMTPSKTDDIATSVDGQDVVHRGSIEADEPALADAGELSSRRQRLSDLFTIFCAGCALISDGYANSLMTLINVVLATQYPTQYVSVVSTRVSNALLVGEVCGQITIGCAYGHCRACGASLISLLDYLATTWAGKLQLSSRPR